LKNAKFEAQNYALFSHFLAAWNIWGRKHHRL